MTETCDGCGKTFPEGECIPCERCEKKLCPSCEKKPCPAATAEAR